MMIKKISTFILLISTVTAAQSGGPYQITQSVIANGGTSSTDGNYTVTGTIAQSVARTQSQGGGFSVSGGFWSELLAPTAAAVSISGRILRPEGRGIAGVRITLIDPGTGEARYAISSSLGFYHFDGVPVGETYVMTVSSKRFVFDPDTRVITLSEEVTGFDWTAAIP